MKNRIIPIIALVAASASAADFQSEFAWRMPLRDGVESGRVYRVKVPPELFNNSQAFPSDIRIIDDHTNQWPYFLWVPAPTEDVEPVSLEMLNLSMVEGPDRYLRQDIHILPEEFPHAGQRPRHDRITLNTGGHQFVRRVDVYGSEDQQNWSRLASGFLIDQEQELKVVNRTIVYPESDFPFLQVRIYPNARDATEDITLRSASVAATRRTQGETEDASLRLFNVPVEEKLPETVQGVVLDQGVKNRPISRLRVEAGTKEFLRAVKVYGRNYETNYWRWVADGSLYRMGEQSHTAVDLPDVPYRFFKLEIYNYDDPPLEVSSVIAEYVPRYLVFEAGKGDAYVYSGSASLGPPQYDLQRRTDAAAVPLARVIRLGEPELNPNRRPPNVFGGWGRFLSLLAVAAVSVLVMLVIVNMVRRQTKT